MTFIHLTTSTIFLAAVVVLCVLIKRLHKSESRFRLLAEHATDIVGLYAVDGRWIYVSPSVQRLLGYTPKEMRAKSLETLIHPDDLTDLHQDRRTKCEICPSRRACAPAHPQNHRGCREGLFDGHPDVKHTFRVLAQDGTYLWFEMSTSPVFRKNTLTHIQVAMRDVSERRRAEDLYRFLIRHLPNTSVFLFDRHFRHLVADGSLMGHTIPAGETLQGRSLWEVFPEDMAVELNPFYRGVFQTGPMKTEKNFRTRTYRIHFLPIHGALGSTDLAMAVFLDVTEEKATVTALEDRTHDLERSNRDLEQFAHVASHELKSPLRRISSFAELLAEEYEGLLSEEADDYINHIINGVESLRSVIESLLTYSRVQTDRTHMAWVDMNQVLESAVRNLAPVIRETGAVVSKGPLPDKVGGDGVLLRQLLENLVGNAIKFNTTGRRPVVLVTGRRDLFDWEFTVTDNGPGIEAYFRDKVFTMFQRLHPGVDGTGIGLALCKKIVGIHRGKIWFESVVGEGTAFKFTLSARSPDEITQH